MKGIAPGHLRRAGALIAIVLFITSLGPAQNMAGRSAQNMAGMPGSRTQPLQLPLAVQDTSIVFAPADSAFFVNQPRSQGPRTSSWGLHILFSENGFGAGLFYRRRVSEDLHGFASLAITSAKDSKEVDYIDPFTGQTYTPDKINRFLMFPLALGVQYELFQDVIMQNFRPHLEAGLGPTLIFSSPYDKDFFPSLKYGQAHYTFNAFVGVGAYFGSDSRNLSGIGIRYYFIPLNNGIPSMNGKNGEIRKLTEFGGVFLMLDVGMFL